MNVIFDLDGVILDSQAAIVEAYRLAGVDAPKDILARESERWCTGMSADEFTTVKRAKDHVYAAKIQQGEVPLLSGWRAAEVVARQHDVHLMTGAAFSAVDALYTRMHPAWPFTAVVAKVTQREKFARIALFTPCVYIDDQPIADGLARVDVRVVCYHGQAWEKLARDITDVVSLLKAEGL